MSIPNIPQEKYEKIAKKLNGEGISIQEKEEIEVPWYPKTEKDLDRIGKVLLDVKDEVNRDHPQFSDPNYR